MQHNKRCPKTGRFLPRTVASLVAEHNKALRIARICRALDACAHAVLVAGILAAYAVIIIGLSKL